MKAATVFFLLIFKQHVSEPLRLCYLHLSVTVFVGVPGALALPAEFLQLGLAALDRLGFRPTLTLILFEGGLRKQKAGFN